jgi:L-seryl-tRNA(Ser) seleniumtransferase
MRSLSAGEDATEPAFMLSSGCHRPNGHLDVVSTADTLEWLERGQPVQSRIVLRDLPSVDRLLQTDAARTLVRDHGREVVTTAVRDVLAATRGALADGRTITSDEPALLAAVAARVTAQVAPSLGRVFNLSGTVLHTNLGRAPLPVEAVEAVAAAAREPSNLELDLATGKRGERDAHVESALCHLTGAEAATVVNNNAAAVLLVLNTLAMRKEVPTSRGELIEIGGSFRMPDVMKRSGCRLVEVGTTNRVHLRDYEEAIGPKTGAVLKVHTSNYEVVGFTAAVPEPELAALCRARGVPFVIDLGSGTLADLERYGLPHEPTPMEALAHGADVVTFSGDKLLGGPQAGIIVGRADLVRAIARNPLKRALRVDKMTVAALAAVLALYRDPGRLRERLPVVRLLARPAAEVRAVAERLLPAVRAAVGEGATIEVVACESQIGSGALPTRTIPSAGLSIRPRTGRRGAGAAAQALAVAFRALPTPVVGRILDDALVLDLRCLEDEDAFSRNLSRLTTG